MKEKKPWGMQLRVDEKLRAQIVRECRERRVRIPEFVSALIEEVFLDSDFVDRIWRKTAFPKSYQRGPSELAVTRTRGTTGGRLVSSDDAHIGTSLENTSQTPSRLSPRQLITEALRPTYATVHPISEAKSQPVDASRKKVSSAGEVIPLVSQEEWRRQSWEELCELMKLPGENLDSELAEIRARWEERWGTPTEQELDQMIEAAKTRREIYGEWRRLYKKLCSAIEQAEQAKRGCVGRSLRLAQRRLTAAKNDFEAFKVRTRWTERKISLEAPWEARQ